MQCVREEEEGPETSLSGRAPAPAPFGNNDDVIKTIFS